MGLIPLNDLDFDFLSKLHYIILNILEISLLGDLNNK